MKALSIYGKDIFEGITVAKLPGVRNDALGALTHYMLKLGSGANKSEILVSESVVEGNQIMAAAAMFYGVMKLEIALVPEDTLGRLEEGEGILIYWNLPAYHFITADGSGARSLASFNPCHFVIHGQPRMPAEMLVILEPGQEIKAYPYPIGGIVDEDLVLTVRNHYGNVYTF